MFFIRTVNRILDSGKSFLLYIKVVSEQKSIIFPGWVAPLVLGMSVGFIYVSTITCWHSGDDIQLAMRVESSVSGEPILHPASADRIVNPLSTPTQIIPQIRYFLELPTLTQIYSAFKMLNWSENAALPMQLTHLVFGVVGVVFFFLAFDLFVPRAWSFITSLGLAFSYAWWYYSTHLDYTIISHAMSCILLYLLALQWYPKTPIRFQWLALGLGIINALTILYLMTGFLLIPVILAALLLNYNKRKARLSISIYLFSMLLAVIVFGAIIWKYYVGLPLSLTNLLKNLTYSGASAHYFALSDVPKTLYGFAKALLTYPALGHQAPHDLLAASSLMEKVSFFAWYALAMLIVVSPFIILAKFYKKLDKYKNFAIVLGLWFCIQVPFGAYWEPSYIKWWTGALIPWWGLVALLMVVTIAKPFFHKVLSIALCILIIFLLAVNLSEFLPNSVLNGNPWLSVTKTLGNYTEPDDLFISSGNHPLDFYLPYFARRSTLSYELIYVSKGKDAMDKDIREAIRVTVERGGKVFLYNFSDQNLGELMDLLESPSVRFEQVLLENNLQNNLPSDFTLYKLTGFEP